MLKPMPPYILIKISKEEQRNRREKLGRFITAPQYRFMKFELQEGEIVAVGAKSKKAFPLLEPGQTILIHHFVTGKKDEGTDIGNFVHEDEKFNYYLVSGSEQNGRGIEYYGIVKDGKIYPSPDFTFLKYDEPSTETFIPEEMISASTHVTESGLLVFNDWKEDKAARMANLKKEVETLSIGVMNEYKIVEIKKREFEMDSLSRELNKAHYKPYEVAFCNPVLNEMFEMIISPGDILYCMDKAAQTTTEFNKIRYRVIRNQYIWALR